MQATRLIPRVPGRSSTGPFAARIQAVRGLFARIRSSEYVAVGSSARFKAAQRTRIRAASRLGFLFIGGAAIFDGIVVFDPHLKSSAVLVALNGAVAVMAIAGWATRRRFPPSRRREPRLPALSARR